VNDTINLVVLLEVTDVTVGEFRGCAEITMLVAEDAACAVKASAVLVAVTTQVVARVVDRTSPVIEHPEVEVPYVVEPPALPPEDVKVRSVPKTPVVEVITNVVADAKKKVKL
jgi:hypothetical protein